METLEAVFKAKEDERKARKSQADAETAQEAAVAKANQAKSDYEAYTDKLNQARKQAAELLAGVK
jgi:hypothetical protein